MPRQIMADTHSISGEQARLSAKSLGCRRGDRLLFRGLDIELAPGDALTLVGPNGIGKSSLLRIVAGLLPIFTGSLEVTGNIALCDDRLPLESDQTLAKALRFWQAIDGISDARRDAALEALDLTALADIPVRIFSTGQRKRAALALMATGDAPIWLVDEPANGLDQAALELLGELFSAHRNAGGVILAASHLPLPGLGDATLDIAHYQPDAEDAL
ncbi:heme ABC exporter ATP-binding protein CcmA [Alterisphingorhabdus coralli]|uniref:Heme ABC exporter ATP-binding protein CcmA n=1 Tax=Alterisphingorhabdus coralli TaxID=3071408 RepID=A0AA97FBR1_9SPHN|nr:heme ABC exporter ATP-binding protein CcmA [Parasphingorhabdus sp. SCSIO 66989]WOE76135.1 heme ABC exporter ATP-binding protein CcmA [Parasphingorhabdus sp. SCSIO 66989]